MGDKPQPPQLPKDVPEDIRLFFDCTRLTVTLKDGELGWITLPDELKVAAKEGAKPKLTIAPGGTPGSATITVSLATKLGFDASFSLPATIKDGQLNVDTSESYLPQGFKDGISQSVKELNDWFKANGYGFGAPAFGKGQVALSKVALPAPAQSTAVPTPVPTPTPGLDMPKPTPPPPPVVPPEPQAAGTDWSHLTPTREQWDKALQEARTEVVPPKPPGVQPPGAKPVVGAGGPGGPKAPVGLGGLAWNYVVLGIVVALLAAAGIYVGGSALGLFGGSGPTPTVSPTAVAIATPTPLLTPTPTPAPQIVTSDDGLVTLTIPYGSVATGTTLTVTPLGQADAPPELAGVTFRGSFYRVGPAEATLTGPIGYERIIDLTALQLDPETQGYPLIQLAERTDDAKWSWLADQTKLVGGPDGMADETKPTQTGMLTRVGDVFGFSRGIYLHRDPYPEEGTTFAVGAPIRIGARITALDGRAIPTNLRPIVGNVVSTAGLIATGVAYSDPLAVSDLNQQSAAITATCTQPGDFVVGLQMDVTPAAVASDSLIAQLGLGTAPTSTVSWTTSVHCAAGGIPTTEPPIAFPRFNGGCVMVVHKPLAGGYPSYLEWVLEFDPLTIPRGAVVVLVIAEEGSKNVTYEAPIAEGRATLQTGITKYGLKLFNGLSVRVTDPANAGRPIVYTITPTFQKLFGQSATVTEKEGSLAGNDCPTPILTP